MKRNEAPRILVLAYQQPMRANGGLASLGHILFRARGVALKVLTNRESTWTAHLRELGVHIEVASELNTPGVAESGRLAQLRGVLDANQRIFERVRGSGFQLVHCNDPETLRDAALGARAAGARVVLNLRAIKADPTPSWSTLWSVPLTDEIIVLSRDMAERLRERVGEGVPIGSIYSIVDLQGMQPPVQAQRGALRQALGIPDGTFAIGYAASLVPRKAQLELIQQGAAEILRAIPNACIYLLGDDDGNPNYAKLCRAAADKIDSERIRFVGFDAHVARWYQSWDATLVASRDEGLARSMIESLACGTPVASFDVPSAHEILTEHGCGTVVPLGDYAALARNLVAWANDERERARVGAVGRRTAEQLFDPLVNAQAYVDRWIALCASRAP